MEDVARYIIRQRGRFGFIDQSGDIVIEPQYLAVEDFEAGFTRVQLLDHWVHLDHLGRPLLKHLFRQIQHFSEDRAAVQLAQRWGFIGTNGELCIPCQFNAVGRFREGLVAAGAEGRWGYLDPKGYWAIDPVFDYAHDFNQGLAPARLSNQYGYIDPDGEWIIPPAFHLCLPFSEAGLAIVVRDNQWGLVNQAGGLLLSPHFSWNQEQPPGGFFEGRCSFRQGSKFGFLNDQGQPIIPPQFDWVGDFSEKLALVAIDDRYGYIDLFGDLVIEAQFPDASLFSEGVAAAQDAATGKWGFINTKGKWVVDPIYDLADNMQNGLARVSLHQQWQYLNKEGAIIWRESA